MEVDDALPDAGTTRIDLLAFLTLPPLQTMHSKKISISGLDDMFLSLVAPKAAKLYKVGGIAD